jgi:integrase
LGDWAEQYLDYAQAAFSVKTYSEKCLAFRMLFENVDPTCPVSSLTPAILLTYLQQQMKARSGYAANKDRKNLVAAWNWGMKYLDPPLEPPNPCLVAKMPEKRTPRYIPPENDFWKVYEVAEGQDKVMLLAYLHLGGRRSEIFRLLVSDLDFENSRVRLSTKKRVGGNLEYDWLPMTRELADALAEWLKNRPVKSEFVFVCIDKTAFTREYYGKPFIKRLHLMRRLCDKAKVKPFGFHAIRHLTASCLYKKGNSVGVIQAILRHKSPSTTERYLKTLGLEQVRDALEGLSKPKKAQLVELKSRRKMESEKTVENKKAV